jgi:hypothetical protein
MAITFYSSSVPVFTKFLGNLIPILEKLDAHASARNTDSAIYLESRLYPDMFSLSRQLQRVTDVATGGLARIASVEVPDLGADVATVSDHIARIRRAIDFLSTLKPEQFDGAEQRVVSFQRRGQPAEAPAERYFVDNIQPNFWFHLTTAYDILRHNGVEIGKRDFLGRS